MNGIIGKAVRWILFLPLAFLILGILQLLPPLGVEWARNYHPELNFLTILLAVVVVSIIAPIVWFWFAAVLMTPTLCCRVIAPHRQTATVIFGTLFVLFQGLFILRLFVEGASWIYLSYQFLIGGLVLAGVIMAYKHDDE